MRCAVPCSLVIVAAGFIAPPGSASEGRPPPPAEAFGSMPAMSHILVSPSGRHYAALQWDGDKQYLGVYDFFGSDPARFVELEAGKTIVEKVNRIHWLNDDTIGVILEFEATRQGTPTIETRLIAVDRDLAEIRMIPKPDHRETFRTQLQHRILDYLPDDPEHILMELDREGRGRQLSVFKVNVNTGRLREVVYGNENVAGYEVDQRGRVRLRYEIREERALIRVKKPGKGKWETLERVERSEGFSFMPVAFTEDPGVMLVSINDSGVDRIVEYDLETRSMGKEIFAAPDTDVTGVVIDPHTREVLGASYALDYPVVHYFDPQLAGIQQSIDKAFPGTQNAIVNFDRDRETFVVFVSGPTVPGTYYRYLVKTRELRKIVDTYGSLLETEDLSEVEPITYQARDGLTIPAYLTRPRGPAPYPMVILPHGGPTARDYLGFDFLAQFLASRGYAVLQPNYRGSAGYGVHFEALGRGEWGLAMQDDLTDGAHAMIERGLADPKRMAIVGWSYGGYAALMGAVRTPHLFQCAVAGAAVTDIRRALAETAQYKFRDDNSPSIGHYRKDREKLRDNSPINNVDVIKIPILLVHGEKDLSVSVGHSKRMAAKLKKHSPESRLVILEDGNHHLALQRNRVRYLRELEAFLRKHLDNVS